LFTVICQEDKAMTRDEVRAVGRKLGSWHERFASCYGRKEARKHFFVYLKGLLLNEGRKNVERMALRFATASDGSPAAQNEVVALQEFLSDSSWEAGDVMREIQAVFAEEFAPSTRQWAIGTVGVIDETSFEKRGSESCGVKRQYCGRLGQTTNCQVGVFLLGVTPAGTALLDHQLYLPKEWVKDKQRREKTRVPKNFRFRTKPQIALWQLERTVGAGQVRFDWIVADALYGHDGQFLSALESLNQRYVVAIAADTRVWPKGYTSELRPWLGGRVPSAVQTNKAARKVSDLGAELPTTAWRVIHLREGAKGPLALEFAMIRVWAIRHKKPGPPVWLLIRRTLEKNPEYKYYLSNGDESTPLETMALVSGTRVKVEEFFEDCKGEFGMADYEARGWSSWHHHMSLVALAHLFVTQTRRELKTKLPELTLPMAMQLLQSALNRPHLTEDDAIRLTEYHLHRNNIARQSHRKSWLQKHKKIIPKPLL
jgi:SRSO17 transposase